jgi:hypothetical protein
MELGYSTEESEHAARAAGYNIERAASLLVGGNLQQEDDESAESVVPAELLLALLRGVGISIPIGSIDEIMRNADDESQLEHGSNLPETEAQTPDPDFTEEESAQIARLQELGFDRELVIRVYLMCDKDEAVAANCLLTMHEGN